MSWSGACWLKLMKDGNMNEGELRQHQLVLALILSLQRTGSQCLPTKVSNLDFLFSIWGGFIHTDVLYFSGFFISV